jgi:signal transduction histidine kinase
VQLEQVLMNLVLNAIEAMHDAKGDLTITSQSTDDGHLSISVSDTGVGIPADKVDRIFDTFFTTKPQGTGMGLAISRSIVESHGGRLRAASNSELGNRIVRHGAGFSAEEYSRLCELPGVGCAPSWVWAD